MHCRINSLHKDKNFKLMSVIDLIGIFRTYQLINLNKLQSSKLRLAYFAWKDINLLTKKPYSSLLEFAWDSAHQEMTSFFGQVGKSYQEIGQSLRTCEFSLYPKTSHGFDAHRESLIVNLWSWMFCNLSAQPVEVGFAPPFLKAGELFHEFQHYKDIKDNNLLGASESALNDFSDQHRSEMEEKAFTEQIKILNRYKKVSPPVVSIITFKVIAWKNNGDCTIKAKKYPLKTKGVIDGLIKQYKGQIDLVREDTSGTKYTEESDKNDVESHLEISRALNLSVDLNKDESYYKKVKVSF